MDGDTQLISCDGFTHFGLYNNLFLLMDNILKIIKFKKQLLHLFCLVSVACLCMCVCSSFVTHTVISHAVDHTALFLDFT